MWLLVSLLPIYNIYKALSGVSQRIKILYQLETLSPSANILTTYYIGVKESIYGYFVMVHIFMAIVACK